MDREFSDSSDDISSKQQTSKKRVKRYCCFENISDEHKKRIGRDQ
jgi:hypothetical protein